MNNSEEKYQLKLHARPQTTFSLNIPEDTLESLRKVAASREMSLEALLKFYIGQSLRQDLSRLFSSRIIEATTQVVSQHIHSSEEVETILQEITKEANR